MSNMIRTENLSKQFGKFKAVKGIDLKVPEGGVYGFLGPNGAGKSTTIRMLLGLIKPTEGKAFLFDKSIKTNRMEILKQVGSMVESPSYYGHLTTYENLKIISEIRGNDEREIDRVLEIVKLKDSKDRKVKNFSMGMKQRLGIAQALLGNPKLLILDEPTNGLDPSGIHQIRDLIRDLPQKTGVTILVSSHIGVPLAVGVGFSLPSVLIANADKYWIYYPWTYPLVTLNEHFRLHYQQVSMLKWLAPAILILFVILAYIQFKRKEVL